MMLNVETMEELQELVPTPQLIEWIKEAKEDYKNGELVVCNTRDEVKSFLDSLKGDLL